MSSLDSRASAGLVTDYGRPIQLSVLRSGAAQYAAYCPLGIADVFR